MAYLQDWWKWGLQTVCGGLNKDQSSSCSSDVSPNPIKVVPAGYRRCPDSHDLTLRPLLAANNLLPPISLTALTLTPKNYPWKPSGTTLKIQEKVKIFLRSLGSLGSESSHTLVLLYSPQIWSGLSPTMVPEISPGLDNKSWVSIHASFLQSDRNTLYLLLNQ